MRLNPLVLLGFIFVGVCCITLTAMNSSTSNSISPLQQSGSKMIQQHTIIGFAAEETVVNSHSNARLKLLADYTRSTVDNAELSDGSSPTVPSNSIHATVRVPPATPSGHRSTLPPPPPPPPPTPKMSVTPVLRFKNMELKASANLSVSDYVSNTFLSTVYVAKAPSDVTFHIASASGVYYISGTVQYEGSSLQPRAIICTEGAAISLSVAAHTRIAELTCDSEHGEPDSVTVRNTTPDDAQISIVDGVTGTQLSQRIVRSGSVVNFKDGKPGSKFVVYANMGGVNWRPAACYYRGTLSITGSKSADDGVHLNCDEAHRAPPALRIINGSGECPVITSVLSAEKADGSTKTLDEFAINCGVTAESFIGVTENSYRRISVKMADGSTPSIVCPAGSTVLIGGSGIHC